MSITLYEPGLQDIDTLVAWRMEVLRTVFDLPAEADLSALCSANRAYYEQTLGRSQFPVFVCKDGVPCGCGALVTYLEMPSPDNPNGRCAYLMNIYTRPDCRGQGLARHTVNWLIQKAKAFGAGKIYLEATPQGRPLYRRLGFGEMQDMMKLEEKHAANT